MAFRATAGRTGMSSFRMTLTAGDGAVALLFVPIATEVMVGLHQGPCRITLLDIMAVRALRILTRLILNQRTFFVNVMTNIALFNLCLFVVVFMSKNSRRSLTLAKGLIF